MNVSQTILAQLGGNRFLAMTGAKNLVSKDDGLMFDLPRGFAAKGINKVIVTLHGDDTYSMAFRKWNSRKLATDLVSYEDGIYTVDLRRVFADATGLDCTLGTAV